MVGALPRPAQCSAMSANWKAAWVVGRPDGRTAVELGGAECPVLSSPLRPAYARLGSTAAPGQVASPAWTVSVSKVQQTDCPYMPSSVACPRNH